MMAQIASPTGCLHRRPDRARALIACGVLGVLILLIGGCQSIPSGPPAAAEPPMPPASTRFPQISDPLIAALRIAGFAPTTSQYAWLSIEVARAQLDRSSLFQAAQTITFIEQLLIGDLPDLAQLECEVAVLKIDIGQDADALQLLQRAIARVPEIEQEAERAAVIRKIIAVTVRLDTEDAQLVQREALDQLLIVREVAIRAATLTQVADSYFRIGAARSAAPLLNQAIPAALSISNPWVRAATLMPTLALFISIGEERPARNYIERTLGALQASPLRGAQDRNDGILAVATLAGAGRIDAAMAIAELLMPAESHTIALIAIADRVQQNLPQRAAEIRLRAETELALQTPPRSRVMLALANSWLRAGNSTAARRVANEVPTLLAGEEIVEQNYADLALLYLDLGDIDGALQIARTEERGGLLLPLSVAERAFSDRTFSGRREIDLRTARDLAFIAQQRYATRQRVDAQPIGIDPDGVQFIGDRQADNENVSPFLRLVGLLARLGEIELALQTIAPLNSTAELARALIALGLWIDQPLQLSARERQLIAAIAATVPAQ